MAWRPWRTGTVWSRERAHSSDDERSAFVFGAGRARNHCPIMAFGPDEFLSLLERVHDGSYFVQDSLWPQRPNRRLTPGRMWQAACAARPLTLSNSWRQARIRISTAWRGWRRARLRRP